MDEGVIFMEGDHPRVLYSWRGAKVRGVHCSGGMSGGVRGVGRCRRGYPAVDEG